LFKNEGPLCHFDIIGPIYKKFNNRTDFHPLAISIQKKSSDKLLSVNWLVRMSQLIGKINRYVQISLNTAIILYQEELVPR